MPIVAIHLSPPGVSSEQKQELIAGVTNLLNQVLDKDPELTHVIIHEVATDNWGYKGHQVTSIENHK